MNIIFSSSSPPMFIYSPVWFVCWTKMAESVLWMVKSPPSDVALYLSTFATLLNQSDSDQLCHFQMQWHEDILWNTVKTLWLDNLGELKPFAGSSLGLWTSLLCPPDYMSKRTNEGYFSDQSSGLKKFVTQPYSLLQKTSLLPAVTVCKNSHKQTRTHQLILRDLLHLVI